MATPLFLPSLSPTMEEGNIAKWHVKPGDKIDNGTLLCSIETDKTTVDYESLDEGYLREIFVQPGTTTKVNALIAILTDTPDEDYAADLAKAKADAEKRTSAAPAPAAPAAAPVTAATPTPAPVAAIPSPLPPPPVFAPVPAAVPAAAPVSEDGRIFASPLAMKIAAEKGIPLSQVHGSGPGGRIVREDVEKWTPTAAPTHEATPSKGSHAPASKVPETPVYGSLAPVTPTYDQPLDQMRKVIGNRLQQSWQQAPGFFTTMKFDMDKLLSLREDLNSHPGYRISVNDLIVKCVAFALRKVPKVNATFHGDFIRYHQSVDISVAVAIPGGLITPIVKDADRKGLGHISAEVKSLVGKAKAGTLAPEEFQGGTFTVSNLGMYGVTGFTSIINPPQACILAVAGTHEELYRKPDGSIGDRKVMECTLTSDHRVVDGALAAEFMQALKGIIESPACLML